MTTFPLALNISYAGTLSAITVQCGSGNGTGTIIINDVPVTGLIGFAISTTEATYTATGLNSFAVDQDIKIQFVTDNSLTNVAISLAIVRAADAAVAGGGTIDCSVTIADRFQILDPIPVVPPGGTLGQYVESGVAHLSIGTQVLNVTFVTPKISANYIFDEAIIKNTVDDPAPEFDFTITNQTTTGFQVIISGFPTTANSFFQWAVRIQ